MYSVHWKPYIGKAVIAVIAQSFTPLVCYSVFTCSKFLVLVMIVLRQVVITASKRSLRRLCFYRCLSVHRGGVCMVAPGGVRGCSWGGMCGCSWGGMRGCSRRGGHVWLLPGGACVVARGGACVGYDEIQRYGQWAGGTHPTGMHSCYYTKNYVINLLQK